MKHSVQQVSGKMKHKDSDVFLTNIKDFLNEQDMESIFKFLDNEPVDVFKKSFLLTEIQNIKVKQVIHNINFYAKQICETEYAQILGIDFIKNKWVREPELVKWKSGSSLAAHTDGQEILPPDITVGGLVYLNEDYEGGELYFPDIDKTIKPKYGDLVFFPCNYMHEVKTILGLENQYRYTLPLFYTMEYKELSNV